MKWLIGLSLAALTACSSTHLAPQLEQVFVKDFESSEPTACTTADVPLGHAQAKAFFARAAELEYKVLSDNYPEAPCRLVGTARHGAAMCDWAITAAHTGWLQCGTKRRYYACDTCDELFAPAAR